MLNITYIGKRLLMCVCVFMFVYAHARLFLCVFLAAVTYQGTQAE